MRRRMRLFNTELVEEGRITWRVPCGRPRILSMGFVRHDELVRGTIVSAEISLDHFKVVVDVEGKTPALFYVVTEVDGEEENGQENENEN